jgi:hypothetical protein
MDDDGHEVGHVAHVVTAGGEHHYWHGWRRDGTPTGVDLGAFPTAERGMVAVDEAGVAGYAGGSPVAPPTP